MLNRGQEERFESRTTKKHCHRVVRAFKMGKIALMIQNEVSNAAKG